MFVFPNIADQLLGSSAPKVKSKVLAKLLPVIETALDSGHTHDQIHAWLEDSGLAIDRKYYQDAIYRLRKKQGAKPAAGSTLAPGVSRPPSLSAMQSPVTKAVTSAGQKIRVLTDDTNNSSFSMSTSPLLF